jgi:ribulose-phosphate 3-epimerase
MIEIIPAIIAKDFIELQEKIEKVEPYVKWAQIDVMDGQFVNNKTWNNPSDLKNLKTRLNLEAHLMVQNPERFINNWIISGIKRIVIHSESTGQPKEVIQKIKQAGLKVGLAINPETSIKVLDQFINQLDLALIMTVKPGRGGQEFLRKTLNKVKSLRQKYPDIDIEVDGGINLKTAPLVIEAGANLLVSGSAIYNSHNIEEVIKNLKG